MTDCVGMLLGTRVGDRDGSMVAVGEVEGETDGEVVVVGTALGQVEGTSDGPKLGATLVDGGAVNVGWELVEGKEEGR